MKFKGFYGWMDAATGALAPIKLFVFTQADPLKAFISSLPIEVFEALVFFAPAGLGCVEEAAGSAFVVILWRPVSNGGM